MLEAFIGNMKISDTSLSRPANPGTAKTVTFACTPQFVGAYLNFKCPEFFFVCRGYAVDTWHLVITRYTFHFNVPFFSCLHFVMRFLQ